MKKTKEMTVSLDADWIEEIVKVLQCELQIPVMDVEEKDALENVVTMSIALYLMLARESINPTSNDLQ